jgi:PncC family amidohydrolase
MKTSGDSRAAEVGKLLQRNRMTLATAESCSGGLLAHCITNVGGASRYFRGGVVAYSNEAKEALLAVPQEMLIEHGAVSEPVARAMAVGARIAFHADYGVGVTGIAGPGGGTDEKPVGLVYIAVADKDGTEVVRYVFDGGRESIKMRTAEQALELLVGRLGG